MLIWIRKVRKIAKKTEVFSVGKRQKITDILGTFDKNEDGAYIIIVDGEEYLFDDYADYFLGGSIEIHAVEEE